MSCLQFVNITVKRDCAYLVAKNISIHIFKVSGQSVYVPLTSKLFMTAYNVLSADEMLNLKQ